ncbi:MAG: hypothetical protein FWD29_01285 [Micrococcales bacterium]|nr:hypothetical protein [Micrococcales bacterium]
MRRLAAAAAAIVAAAFGVTACSGPDNPGSQTAPRAEAPTEVRAALGAVFQTCEVDAVEASFAGVADPIALPFAMPLAELSAIGVTQVDYLSQAAAWVAVADAFHREAKSAGDKIVPPGEGDVFWLVRIDISPPGMPPDLKDESSVVDNVDLTVRLGETETSWSPYRNEDKTPALEAPEGTDGGDGLADLTPYFCTRMVLAIAGPADAESPTLEMTTTNGGSWAVDVASGQVETNMTPMVDLPVTIAGGSATHPSWPDCPLVAPDWATKARVWDSIAGWAPAGMVWLADAPPAFEADWSAIGCFINPDTDQLIVRIDGDEVPSDLELIAVPLGGTLEVTVAAQAEARGAQRGSDNPFMVSFTYLWYVPADLDAA